MLELLRAQVRLRVSAVVCVLLSECKCAWSAHYSTSGRLLSRVCIVELMPTLDTPKRC
jgi:hypothetical protein